MGRRERKEDVQLFRQKLHTHTHSLHLGMGIGYSGDGGSFLACKDFGECSTIHSPPALFFF